MTGSPNTHTHRRIQPCPELFSYPRKTVYLKTSYVDLPAPEDAACAKKNSLSSNLTTFISAQFYRLVAEHMVISKCYLARLTKDRGWSWVFTLSRKVDGFSEGKKVLSMLDGRGQVSLDNLLLSEGKVDEDALAELLVIGWFLGDQDSVGSEYKNIGFVKKGNRLIAVKFDTEYAEGLIGVAKEDFQALLGLLPCQ